MRLNNQKRLKQRITVVGVCVGVHLSAHIVIEKQKKSNALLLLPSLVHYHNVRRGSEGGKVIFKWYLQKSAKKSCKIVGILLNFTEL